MAKKLLDSFKSNAKLFVETNPLAVLYSQKRRDQLLGVAKGLAQDTNPAYRAIGRASEGAISTGQSAVSNLLSGGKQFAQSSYRAVRDPVLDIMSGGQTNRSAQSAQNLLSAGQGAVKTLKGASQIVTTPISAVLGGVAGAIPDQRVNRLLTGVQRGITDQQNVGAEVAPQNVKVGPLEFDPLLTAGSFVGFTRNPMWRSIFPATSKLQTLFNPSTKSGKVTNFVFGRLSKGGIEGLVQGWSDMPENATPEEKVKHLLKNAGFGALAEISVDTALKGVGSINDKYTKQALTEMGDKVDEFVRRMRTPVKTTEIDPVTGLNKVVPMWQEWAKNKFQPKNRGGFANFDEMTKLLGDTPPTNGGVPFKLTETGSNRPPVTDEEKALFQKGYSKFIKKKLGNESVLPQSQGGVPEGGVGVAPSSGAIDQLPPPAVDIPPVGQRERGLVTSVKEASNISPEVKSQVEGTYTPKPDEQLMGEAKALLEDNVSLKINNVKDVDKKVAATIQEAINLQNQGNHQAAANLFNNLFEQATELGRGVHAFSLLEKMSPESIALSLSGKIRKYNQTALRKIPELTGEQLKMISDKVTAADLLTGREKQIAINDLYQTLDGFIPSSLVDKAMAVWKAGLLTSLRTHERNFVGNTIHMVAETAKDVPATFMDKILGLRTGQRTVTATLRGMGEFGSKTTRQQMSDIMAKGFDPSDMMNKFDHKQITWGKNPVEQLLKKYTDVVFRSLGAADKPFYNSALARSLYDQAGAIAINEGKRGNREFIDNLVKNPTAEMVKTAISDANVATFKNKNMATTVASGIKNNLSKSELGKIAGEVTMPFTGVPSSILGQFISYSPAGLLRGVANSGRVAIQNLPELQRQAAQEVGRGAIGTGVFALGAYLMSKGLITGQPKDIAEQRQWELENKPRNSILIGGKWHSLNSIGPEAVVFLAGSKLQEELSSGGSVANYGVSLGKDFLDQSFVTGLQQPVNALTDPNRYGKSYAGSLLSSPIPNLVKDVAKATDTASREMNTVSDYVKGAIPGVRNQLLPKRTVLGDVIPQEPSGAGAFLNLFNSKTKVSTPLIDEFSRLQKEGINALPSKLSSSQTILGEKTKLSPQELDKYESMVGERVKSALEALVQTDEYRGMSDEDKEKVIDKVVSKYKKEAKDVFQAEKVVDQLRSLNTSEKKKAKLKEYVSKGVVTEEVLSQIAKLLK